MKIRRTYSAGCVCLWAVLFLSLLQIGSIRRKDDAVIKTQTDPITYKKKSEELKEGVKGAPSPVMVFYDNEEFLIEPPMEEERGTSGFLEPEARIPEFGEPIPEDTRFKEEPEAAIDWWMDESDTTNLEKDEEVWWMES